MDAAAIVRAAIPDADDDTVSYVLWERTPYPFAKVSPQALYQAASTVRRAGKRGLRLCEQCDSPALYPGWLCARCSGALHAPPPLTP